MKAMCFFVCLSSMLIARFAAAAQPAAIRGTEVVAAITEPTHDLRVTGRMFVAGSVTHVRMVLIVVRWGNGPDFYSNEDVRRLTASIGAAIVLTEFQKLTDAAYNMPRRADEGGGEALLRVLQQLGRETGRREIADAPLLFWGHSAAGPFGAGFAALHPDRTLAFVRYHSGPMAGGEVPPMTQVPALFLVGGKDTATGAPGGWTNGVDGARALWQFGRSGRGPWTFAIDPEADHASMAALERANTLTIPWIAAIVRLRLGPAATLSQVVDTSGWTGSMETGDVVRASSATTASWLPDEESVTAWRALRQPRP